MMGMPRVVVIAWTLVLTLLLAGEYIEAEVPKDPSSSWGFGGAFRRNAAPTNSTSSSGDGGGGRWSSMLDVNPSKMLSLMIRHGGLLIPDSIKNDLTIMGEVCHADSIRLNVVERKLVIHNFTVHLPGEQDALSVGRVYLHWDSYKHPCVDIEVDNVTVLVEFLNVMMTQHNWDKLKKFGFPPTFPDPPEEQDDTTTTAGSTFLRIGSIDLSGDICAYLKSRPLKKDIALITWDLDLLDDLNMDIRAQSDINLVKLGKRGCTTDELYDILRIYFGKRTKQFLADTIDDIADGGKDTIQAVNKLVGSTKKNVLQYASDAGEWTEGQITDKLARRLQAWGTTFSDKLNDEAMTSIERIANQVNTVERIATKVNTTRLENVDEAVQRIRNVFSPSSSSNRFFTQGP